jgi:ABC-type transport system involved in multi-copper enzyme maturation permease subunit
LRRINIVFNRDFREYRRTSSFLIIVIIFTLITITAAVLTNILLARQEWLQIRMVALPILELIIGLMAYYLPLFILMTFIWAFSSLPIIKEKVNGNIASLCATTLTPKEIWIGKSMAIFLPGFVISVVSTLIVLLSINFTTIRPAIGEILLPAPLIIVSLLINPLLFLGLLLFIILFSLARNPDIAIAPSFIVGFGLMMGIPLGMVTGNINLTSWSFCLWNMFGTAILWVVVLFSSRLLTKENIVLSSKGD